MASGFSSNAGRKSALWVYQLAMIRRFASNPVWTHMGAVRCNMLTGALVPRWGTVAGVPGPRRSADECDAGWFAPVATRRRSMSRVLRDLDRRARSAPNRSSLYVQGPSRPRPAGSQRSKLLVALCPGSFETLDRRARSAPNCSSLYVQGPSRPWTGGLAALQTASVAYSAGFGLQRQMTVAGGQEQLRRPRVHPVGAGLAGLLRSLVPEERHAVHLGALAARPGHHPGQPVPAVGQADLGGE